MASEETALLRQRITALCERGVLQGLSETTGRAGKVVFTFRWLHGKEYTLEYQARSQQLLMKALLPGIANRSLIDRDLRQFIAARASPATVQHQRIDPANAELRYRNRQQSVSLILTAKQQSVVDGVSILLNTVNALFSHLGLYHVQYLNRHFDLPEE